MSKKKALIVGIDEYREPNRLTSCVGDGKALERRLREIEGFDEIRELYNLEATVENVEAELERLTREVVEGDSVVFCYSGHGCSGPEGSTMQEYIVLLRPDGEPAFWKDDTLVRVSQQVPQGTFLVYLDCCHARGMNKLVLSPEGGEVAKIKAFQLPPAGSSKAAPGPTEAAHGTQVLTQRRFGRPARALRWKGLPAPGALADDASEAGQPELNATLAAACLEDETASAATSQTGGLSAFTCMLLRSLPRLPPGASCRQVMDLTASALTDAGFRQTCCAWAPPGTPLLDRSFFTLQPLSDPPSAGAAVVPERSPSAPRRDSQLFEALLAALPYWLTARPTDALPTSRKPKDGTRSMSNSTPDTSSNGFGADKFFPLLLPLIAAVVPPIIEAASNGLSHRDRKPDRKDLETAPEPSAAEHARHQLWSAALSCLPYVSPPPLLRHKPVASAEANGDTGAKAFPIDLLRAGIEVFGDILRATSRKKDLELSAPAAESLPADKAFLNLVGAVLQAAPHVARTLTEASTELPREMAAMVAALSGLQRRAA
jgi:hypothetical protein